jgi:hypothetical protein
MIRQPQRLTAVCLDGAIGIRKLEILIVIGNIRRLWILGSQEGVEACREEAFWTFRSSYLPVNAWNVYVSTLIIDIHLILINL